MVLPKASSSVILIVLGGVDGLTGGESSSASTSAVSSLSSSSTTCLVAPDDRLFGAASSITITESCCFGSPLAGGVEVCWSNDEAHEGEEGERFPSGKGESVGVGGGVKFE